MAYDRYDARRERESSRRSDYDRGRGDERGFFERAGDEIASWFGDDERDPDRDRDRGQDQRMMNRGDWNRGDDRDRGDWRSSGSSRGYDYDRGGSRSRYDSDSDQDEPSSARPMDWTSSQRDYRSGSERGFGERGGERGGYRPLAGDYARSDDERGRDYDRSDSAWGRDDYRRTSYAGSTRDDERHYNSWRQREMDDLDRDYDDYHRERQQHFEKEFGSWREKRQQKRQMLGQAREHMQVVGSDGEPVGKVDRIAGDRVVLTKTDSPDGRHHSIPCTMIDRVEDDRLTLDCTAEQAQRQWSDGDRERGLFERDDQDRSGPHMLERSFSGTYRR